MRESGLGVSSYNVTAGGFINTDAKVGDINSYVTYAATDTTPYFISTYSRHQDFTTSSNRKRIIRRVQGEVNTETAKLIDTMANQIAEEETKKIQQSGIGSIPSIGGDVDLFIDYMNNINGETETLEETISKMIGSIQRAYFSFMDDYKKRTIYGRCF